MTPQQMIRELERKQRALQVGIKRAVSTTRRDLSAHLRKEIKSKIPKLSKGLKTSFSVSSAYSITRIRFCKN